MKNITITGHLFEMPTDGGYVYEVRAAGQKRQICEGGGLMGGTLRATPETLRAVCQKWLRQRTRR
jgi:hypothetical protein